jgi:hypothetical protein
MTWPDRSVGGSIFDRCCGRWLTLTTGRVARRRCRAKSGSGNRRGFPAWCGARPAGCGSGDRRRLRRRYDRSIVLWGGVFENDLRWEDFQSRVRGRRLRIRTNRAIPPNAGGLNLGQAARGASDNFDSIS